MFTSYALVCHYTAYAHQKKQILSLFEIIVFDDNFDDHLLSKFSNSMFVLFCATFMASCNVFHLKKFTRLKVRIKFARPSNSPLSSHKLVIVIKEMNLNYVKTTNKINSVNF